MKENVLRAKAIFLDLDGTIVDSTQAYLEAAKVSFETIGQPFPTVSTALEIPRRLEQGYSISDITNGETKRFLSIYLRTFYSVTPQKTKLLPNVLSALKLLSEKNKLALITMRYVPWQSVVEELEFFGVSEYFSQVVTALDTAKPKPSPESILFCAKALNVDLSDCIMAGDSVNDIRAGKAAGAGTVAVLSGLYESAELAKETPDLILNDVTALPKFVA